MGGKNFFDIFFEMSDCTKKPRKILSARANNITNSINIK